MKLILVLGSPNAADGILSPMAESRLKTCLSVYAKEKVKIMLTGGFGTHFNISDKPHAYHLKQRLIAAGVPEEDILALVESRHSVEDATLSKWAIEEYNPEAITIITSDYHYERAKVIFEAVYAPFQGFSFSLASSEKVDPEILEPLLRHEKVAMQDLLDNGLRF